MKRGTQFLILSFLFALCVAQDNWDQSLEGNIQTVADRNYPCPFQPNVTMAPMMFNSTDLTNNTNNNFLRTHNSTQISLLLAAETANKTADDLYRSALLVNATSFVQARALLSVAIFNVLNGRDSFDPTVQDFVLVSRGQLRALAARYRDLELSKYGWWYQQTSAFSLRLAAIRQSRIVLLQAYLNASLILEDLVARNCAGLGLLVPCTVNNLLSATSLNLANLTSSLNVVNSSVANVTSLTTSYNADVNASLVNYNSTVANYDEYDMQYQETLSALENFRSYELPTWENVVARLQVLFVEDDNLEMFKQMVAKLWYGWQLGDDGQTLEFSNSTVIESYSQQLNLTFSVKVVRDQSVNSTVNETAAVGAQKFQSACESVVQTYGYVAKLHSEPVMVLDGMATVMITVNFVDVENARQIALYSLNVSMPDNSTYINEYNQFSTDLQNNAAGLATSVNNTLQNLTQSYQQLNAQIQQDLAVYLQAREQFYQNASAEVSVYTQQAQLTTQQVSDFAAAVVQRYLQSANQTIQQLQQAVAQANSSFQEADARVQVLKLQAIQISAAASSSGDQATQAALQASLASVKSQLQEAYQYREFKKQVYLNVSASVDVSYSRAEQQQMVLQENVQNITANVTIGLVAVKQRIRNNYQDFVDSVVVCYKAYRESYNNLTVSAGNDLNVDTNVSLTFTVVIIDSGVVGEDAVNRTRAQIALLRAIFAAITTDVKVQVTASAKRQAGSNAYTVSSGTPTPTTPTNSPTVSPTTPTNSPTASPTTPTNSPTVSPTTPSGAPTGAPTNPPSPTAGAMSVAMSFLALIASMFVLLI